MEDFFASELYLSLMLSNKNKPIQNDQKHRKFIIWSFKQKKSFLWVLFCDIFWSPGSSNETLIFLFEIIRLNCRDFLRIFSNHEICEMSGIRSFNSVRIINDTAMLHYLCTNTTNTVLTIWLMQRSLSFSRYPDNKGFIDMSCKQICRQSFINRAKRICKLIPFKWINLRAPVFKNHMKCTVRLHISKIIFNALSLLPHLHERPFY